MLYARNFPIRRGKLRIVNSLWRAALDDQSVHRLAALKHGRFRMQCDLREMLQRQFYFFGTYFLEEDLLRCWETAAKGAEFILDVGANAGIYSLAALAIQPDATVHAFEPTPEIAARLRETAKLNSLDGLQVHELAVFSDNGEAVLKRLRGDFGDNEGMNFVARDIGDTETERVRTVCIDQFCQDHAIDHIDLMKLDIQGQEHAALQGAKRLINSGNIGKIFMELNWAESTAVACPATESIQLLEEAGYRFSRPGKRLKWEQKGEWLRTLNDVVASQCRPNKSFQQP
jgi:FkbM family methyltransferase